jgi:hypothetical protein
LSADGKEHVTSGDRGIAFLTIESDDNIVALATKRDALGASSYRDAFAFQNDLNFTGHVVILAGDQCRTPLHDCHLRAEPAVHLREFQSDVAPAHDNEMIGQETEVHHGTVRQIGHFSDAGHVWSERARTDIDKNPLRFERAAIHRGCVGARKAGVSTDQPHVFDQHR